MGTILSTGIGSGLDVAGLVSQLVAAEGRPQSVRLDTEEARLQAKLSAIGTLRSALQAFHSAVESLSAADRFRARAVKQTDTEFFSASASASASFGSYEIEVQQLATPQRLASAAFAAPDAAIGTGTLTISVGGATFDVEIAGEGTLVQIRDAINAAPSNTGVAATLVSGVDGARLILSAVEAGAHNQITVNQTGGDGGLAALVHDPAQAVTNLTEIQPAQNARLLIDGFLVESAGNTVSEAIEGLDIVLLAAHEPGDHTSLTIELDRASAKEAIGRFVDGYNKLFDAVSGLTGFDGQTQTAGPLLGDAGLRNLVFQLRRELSSVSATAPAGYKMLSELGVSTQLDGRLAIDASKLDASLDGDFEAVGAFFTEAQGGLGNRLSALLEPYLQSGGVLDRRREGLSASIDTVKDRREALNARLQALEQRLFRQFNALDTLLAQLQGTSSFLARQLDNLPRPARFGRDD